MLQEQDGLPRVGRRGGNGSGWNAAWQNVPFEPSFGQPEVGQRSSGASSGSSRATQTWRSLGCECLGGCHGLFHSVLLHLSVSQARCCTTSPPIVLVPIGEASHKYAERWAFGAEGETIREPLMQDGKQSRQCRTTVTVGEKGWWTRRRGGGVVHVFDWKSAHSRSSSRGAGAPRGGFLVHAGLEHTVQDSRSRDCPVGPNIAIGRGEQGQAAQSIERWGFVDRPDGRLGTHRDPRFAARVVARKQGTGLWQAGLLP